MSIGMLLWDAMRSDIRFAELEKAIKDGNIVPDYKKGIELVAQRAKTGDWLGLVDDLQCFNWHDLIQSLSILAYIKPS